MVLDGTEWDGMGWDGEGWGGVGGGGGGWGGEGRDEKKGKRVRWGETVGGKEDRSEMGWENEWLGSSIR